MVVVEGEGSVMGPGGGRRGAERGVVRVGTGRGGGGPAVGGRSGLVDGKGVIQASLVCPPRFELLWDIESLGAIELRGEEGDALGCAVCGSELVALRPFPPRVLPGFPGRGVCVGGGSFGGGSPPWVIGHR